MATTVFMEALSPTMEEGRLVKWHKHEGDAVKAGDTLAEVETDKAIMDLQARADGMLRQVSVAEGQTVPVGKEIAVIVAPGESAGAAPVTPAPAATTGSGKRETLKDSLTAAGSVATAPAPPPVAVAAIPAPTTADAAPIKASPLARRIAKEAGVDLKRLTGRISRADRKSTRLNSSH